jgi:hypothetical protein
MTSNPDGYRSPRRAIAFIFIGLVIASLVIFGIYQLTKSDDADDTAAGVTETTQSNTVSASDEDITELPQNPSLRLFEEEGTTYVGNDGNVTMSNIQVLDAAGATVCDLGTISPGDRLPCPEAASALGPVTATGSGPQGQPVETGLE